MTIGFFRYVLGDLHKLLNSAVTTREEEEEGEGGVRLPACLE